MRIINCENLCRRSLCSLILLILGSQSLSLPQSVKRNFKATQKDAERLARFEKQTEQLRLLLKIPGLSAVIIRGEKVIWARGFGYSDLAKRIPATPDTIYHIASLTKTFAATILMQLVEQGKLDLDEPMSKYSPDFKDDSVKIKHLFSHTSSSPPGERFRYSGSQYAHLTAVIEKKTGKPFRAVFTEMFLDRLKMSNSIPGRDVLTEANKQSIVFGRDKPAHYKTMLQKSSRCYRLYGDEAVETGYGWGGISAAAGLLSTVADLAKFDIAINRQVYVRKETQDKSWTPFVSNSGQALQHGLGWFVQEPQGLRIIWHYGYDPDSFSGTYVKVPDKELTLILLANTDALSSPFVGSGIIKSSPFVSNFLRMFVFEDSQARALPDPDWTKSVEGFSDELTRLKKQSGRYSFDRELASHTAMIKWLEERRKQARTAIKLDPTALDEYVGKYQLPDGVILTVIKEGNRLMMDIPKYIKSEMFAAADMKFFLKTLDGDFVFIKNAQGEITHLELYQGRQPTIIKRIK